MFDRAVCINLDRRPDRMERFWQDLPEPWPFVGVERAAAVDGELAQPPDWFCPSRARVRSPQRHRGAWGCLRSHQRVMEDALCDGIERLLVFEDDAICGPDFANRAERFLDEVPSDWDQIYLGGQHLHRNYEDPQRINEQVLRCHRVNRTHAYAISRTMMAAVYTMLSDQVDALYDADLHIDFRMGDMQATGDWNIYAPIHWMVGQAGGTSDVRVDGNKWGINYWDTYEEPANA